MFYTQLIRSARRKLATKNAKPVISFVNLRRLIGILGMVLPLACWIGGKLFAHIALQSSISFYYYTNVRDIFVGILAGVGMFLLSYRGYQTIDCVVSSATGCAALGIALFPCLNRAFDAVGFFMLNPERSNTLHVVCAGLFFLLLAVNSIFIFTMTDDKSNMTPEKKIRNIIYIACGVIILLVLAVMMILHIRYTQEELDRMTVIFVLETVLLEAFGISWLVKGETILRDRPSFARGASRVQDRQA